MSAVREHNHAPPTETATTIYRAGDSQLREAALLAIGSAGYRVKRSAGMTCYLTVWHTHEDRQAIAAMAARFGLRPWA